MDFINGEPYKNVCTPLENDIFNANQIRQSMTSRRSNSKLVSRNSFSLWNFGKRDIVQIAISTVSQNHNSP